jgi:hypothetical protein
MELLSNIHHLVTRTVFLRIRFAPLRLGAFALKFTRINCMVPALCRDVVVRVMVAKGILGGEEKILAVNECDNAFNFGFDRHGKKQPRPRPFPACRTGSK